MENKIVFNASLMNVRIDSEGAAKVLLAVPHSSLGDVVQLTALTDVLLEVTVTLKLDPIGMGIGGGAAQTIGRKKKRRGEQ